MAKSSATRTDSEWYTVVAQSVSPSLSSRFRRASGACASTAQTTAASISATTSAPAALAPDTTSAAVPAGGTAPSGAPFAAPSRIRLRARTGETSDDPGPRSSAWFEHPTPDRAAHTITQSAAESVAASAVSRSGAPNCAATVDNTRRQSGITPLWLNAQRPWVNGAHAERSTGIPTVADRTAPSTDVDRNCGNTSSTAGSVQIGAGLR